MSERTTNSYTDTAPSTTYLGDVYDDASTGNDCPTPEILPLTSDKTALHDEVDTFAAVGTTAGHLGAAWGWYMVSPNFAYLWPTASQPAAYNSSNLIKAVVLMTDGDFNTQYCDGVVSADSWVGGWNADDGKINCDAPNGDSASQFNTICTNIKAQNIILYTVGFQLGTNTTAKTRLQNCATDTSHFFDASTGTDLTTAFTQIAQSLNNLRVSK